MNVAARIKQIRKDQTGLSRKEIAQLLGISISDYEDIENGNIDITLTRLDEIARILNVPTSYLLGGQKTSPAFVNHFYNGAGNKGTINIVNMYQGYAPSRLAHIEEIKDDTEQIETLDIPYKEDVEENKEQVPSICRNL